MHVNEQDIFHVHTYRCRHAQMIPESAYIEKAIELGAPGIWFSDHAPFPGDRFTGRMRLDELNGYLAALSELRSRYKDRICVHIGIEIEYLPSFDEMGYTSH